MPQINSRATGLEVDALFAAERVIVELDGWQFHRNRETLEPDDERTAILAAAGYLVIRFTWWKLTPAPAWVAAQLRQALESRRFDDQAAGQSA
jgi:very-short-patch-repair endonuclease